MYVTAIKGRDAVKLMRELAPYMGSARRRQIGRALGSVGSSRMLRASDDRDRYWLAGLFEGEAHFGPRRGRASVHVSLEMCERDVVARAARAIGAERPRRIVREAERGWRPTHKFVYTGRKALDLMRELRPLMGERRKAQIDRALASWTPVRLVPAPIGCVVEGCDGPHRSRGLCHKHYMRWSRYRAAGRDSGIRPLR